MTSGAFSRRSRLSSKALRIYDELELLMPAEVDPTNGYRYYAEHQLGPARLIGLLRTLGMPLAVIAEVINLEPQEAVTAIEDYWEAMECAHEKKRALVGYLQHMITGKESAMYEVETREVGEQRVATIERRVLAGELPAFIDEAMNTLHSVLSSSGATTGIPFVVYHGEVNLDSDGPVEVCVPYSGQVEVREPLRLRIEPSHREAFTRIVKKQVNFPEILDAYASVEGWLSDSGQSTSGSPREVYFTDWAAAGPDDPACDIAFPFE